MAEIECLRSKVVYQNKWMTVREDIIRRETGQEGLFGIVDKPDFVVIVPVQDQQIILVEQYRYPVKERCLELPQGAWENSKFTNPNEVALGELQTETGYVARQLHYVGFQYLATGYSTQGYHIYFATDLEMTKTNLDLAEAEPTSRLMHLWEFEALLETGDITDATTLAAYSLTKLKGFVS